MPQLPIPQHVLGDRTFKRGNGVKTRLLLDVSIQSSWSPYNKGTHREAHLECVAHTQRHTWSVWHVNRQQGGEPSASQGERSHRELIQPVIHLRLPASRTVRKVWISYPACGVCYSGPSKLTQWSPGLSVHPHLHTTRIKEGMRTLHKERTSLFYTVNSSYLNCRH